MASTSSRRRRRRLLLLGGLFALVTGLLIKREQVAALLPSRSSGGPSPTPTPEPAPAPAPSNYDAPGPPANTATPVPVPEAQQPPAIDEAAEEAAAAAEAANIGGQVSEYAGPAGEPATEEERPLAEAGEGEAEGQEQTEAELAAAAEPTAPGASPEQHQIEDAIEAVDDAGAGERVEPLPPVESDAAEDVERPADQPAPFEGPGATTPAAPPTGIEATPPITGDEEAAGSAAPSLWSQAEPGTETPAVPPTAEQPTEPLPAPPAEEPTEPAAPAPPEQAPSTPTWGPGGWSPPQPGGEKPAEPAKPAEESKPDDDEDNGGGWQTWSGRSVSR
jgi:hypothetical protein